MPYAVAPVHPEDPRCTIVRPAKRVAPFKTCWYVGISIALALGAAFLLYAASFVLGLSSILVGSLQFHYSVDPLMKTCPGRSQWCFRPEVMRAVAVGCAVVGSGICIAMAVLEVQRFMTHNLRLGVWEYVVGFAFPGTIVASVIGPGVGVVLQPLDGFSAGRAFVTGIFGFVTFVLIQVALHYLLRLLLRVVLWVVLGMFRAVSKYIL
ncbi:hypothetical protein OH76DRAFT_1410062 [Lentinus brumalis]|uniref:Uncharacterized protein n=1 Tax=Lentinus brumalis TaxID=2498619 RepID=A0A371CTE3_9APHY|nr:hypothetical protein OH76DRAFT_1410062 [Polyporus brumalis]